ncbi:hypothetical protein [Lentibacillus sp. CBA3610]|uniref:hypothetical protein n=1 Tax=Lentibacillus sp. CBA3610 TaxID=2518176 RepID=UPI0015953B61|nr:hypothetical protein [Lentibacillus sp. CBA3610]QKY70566.1 hypothetical protein Len3610_14065 [Lentibacillus sp. CBA3610]
MFKKNGKNRDPVPMLTAIAIIMCFMSIFAPFIVMIIFQDVFYYQKQQNSWIFQAPMSSYSLCGAAILYVGIVFGLLAYYRSNWEGKKLITTAATAIASIPALIMIYITINHYYYMTEEGSYHNHLFAMKETLYQWEEIEQAVAVSNYNENNSEVTLSELQLTTTSGEVLSYRYNRELIRNQRPIRNALEQNNVELQQRLEGKEGGT